MKLVNKRSIATSILTLKDGSSLITTETGKAQLLNNFFHSCFNRSFDPLSNPDPLDPSNSPSDLLCTENQIIDLLLSLNTAKSTGPDSISDAAINCIYNLVAIKSPSSLLPISAFQWGFMPNRLTTSALCTMTT